MERPSWVQQVYGYAVCLVAIITFLVAISNFVEAALERTNPLQAQSRYGYGGEALTSFEAYRATRGERPMRPTRTDPARPPSPGDTLTTAELRAEYEALRADRAARVTFESTKRMVKDGLLVVLALVLFATHWRWLRGKAAE